MNSFDVVIELCPAVRQWVRLDQSRDECARRHGCPNDRVCPLGTCFAKRAALPQPAAR